MSWLLPAAKAGTVEDAKSAVVVAPRSAGRRGRGRARLGANERVWAITTPITFRLPNRDNAIYKFADRYVLTPAITSSTIAAQFSAQLFSVASMGNISALTSLFDQYRIIRVHVMVTPTAAAASGSSIAYGRLSTVVDYDDAAALSTEQQALDYQSCLTGSGGDGQYRVFQPHAAFATYAGAFTSFANVASPWIDAANTGVQHYGLKYAWSVTGAVYSQDAIVMLETEWRNVR